MKQNKKQNKKQTKQNKTIGYATKTVDATAIIPANAELLYESPLDRELRLEKELQDQIALQDQSFDDLDRECKAGLPEIDLYSTSREGIRDWLDKASIVRHDRLDIVFNDDKRLYKEIKAKPQKPEEYFKLLLSAFEDCDYSRASVILHAMPLHLRQHPAYSLLTSYLMEFQIKKYDHLINRGWNSESYQPCKSAVVEQLLYHHPDKNIRITGLELIMTKNMGAGVAFSDLSLDLHSLAHCQWVWTSYLNAQDAEGYNIPDKFCPQHGNKHYPEQVKAQVYQEWQSAIKSAVEDLDSSSITALVSDKIVKYIQNQSRQLPLLLGE